MFKRMLFTRGAGALALCAALTLAASAQGARVVLPAGTVIPVRLDQRLSSVDAWPGETFTATVRDADAVGLPPGTQVQGVVRDVEPQSGDQPGVLDVGFRRVVLPDGETRAIDGSLISLDSSHVRTTSNGRMVANGKRNSNPLKFIGVGAGAGALIGALGLGDTLSNALLGAGAGYLFSQLNGGHARASDVVLTQGTEFGVRLDRRVALNVDNDYYRSAYGNTYRYDDRYYNGGVDSGPYYGDRYDNDRYYSDRYRRAHRSYSGDRDIVMVYNGRTITFPTNEPFVQNDVVYLPLRQVADATGFSFTYDADDQMIRALNGSLTLPIGSRAATLYGDTNTLAGPAIMRDGVVYVPMQFVVLATGGKISYDSDTHQVTLNTDIDRGY